MPRLRKRYTPPRLRSLRPRLRDPERAARLRELAYAYMEAQQPEGAAEILRGALVLDPVAPAGRASLALALYGTGDLENALAWLGPFTRCGLPEVEFLRGRILADLSRVDEALDAFACAVRADATLLEAHAHRVELLLQQGEVAAARSEAEEALRKAPGHPRALRVMAVACTEAGDGAGALEALGAIPPSARGRDHALLSARASVLAGRGDAEVDQIFEEGLQAAPHDTSLTLAFCRHLASRRATDPEAEPRALALLEGLVNSEALDSGTHAQACFALGELLMEDPASSDRAEALFTRGLLLRPDDPVGLTGLGALLLSAGRPSHAVPWLLRSLLADPRRPRTVEFLAKALCAIEDDEAVARWFGLFVAGAPREAPALLAQMLRFVQEAGRSDAYQDLRREGHRLKNLVAVQANRASGRGDEEGRRCLEELYAEWSGFLSRIHALPRSPVPVTFSAVARRAIEQARTDAIQCFFAPALPLLMAEADSLGDALANILRNALEASPPGAPVRLSARPREGGRFVEVSISDEGPGISLEDQRRIFDPGFTRKEGGSGVGLAVARRVIMAHGGRISVASGPGGPTTFRVRLPALSWSLPTLPREVLHAR